MKTYADNVASNEATVTQSSLGTVNNTTGSAVKVDTESTIDQSNNSSTQANNVENTTPTNVTDTTPSTETNISNSTDTTTPTTDTVITGTTPVTAEITPPTTAPIVQPDTLEAPTISVSVSTNSLDLGNVNAVNENSIPNVSITVQSNSKYQLSVKGADDFKGDDTSHTMSIEHLKVKLKGENSFKNMKKTQVILADNEPVTDSKTYHVEFKLNPDWQVRSGKYGTTVTFEVEAIK